MSVNYCHVENLLINSNAKIKNALEVIDKTGHQGALVCKSRVLEGIITDSDIRKHLLSGGDIHDSISRVFKRDFVSVNSGCSLSDSIAIMMKKKINLLPVLNVNGEVESIHTLHNALISRKLPNVAVIMAGGFGKRLGELTQALPKPMLPIGDKPMLEHIVNHLVSFGIKDIYISINYLSEMIVDYFGDGSKFLCNISYLREKKPLGTGGALSLIPVTPRDPLIIMNGDLMTAFAIDRLLEFHKQGDFSATMCLRDYTVEIPFGVVGVRDCVVQEIVEKPALNHLINAGIYTVNSELIDLVPKNEFFPITKLFEKAMNDGYRIGGYHIQEGWRDVGMPDEYEEANKSVL